MNLENESAASISRPSGYWKGSIIYGATMYIWQFEYSSYSNPELPLLAYEVKNSWDEKSVRWGNQPAVDGAILDYKK